MRRLILLIWLVLLTTGGASARTWYVKPDSTGDVPTISVAVDSAAAQGDTILLADGAFTGEGNREVDCLDKALVITSESGNPALCTIDLGYTPPGYLGTALHFRESENGIPRLEGITIRGACQGVVCHESSAPVIYNCVFTENRCAGGDCSPGGAAMLCKIGSSPLIADCTFHDNYGGSGGIDFLESSATVAGCVFTENGGQAGGAIMLVGGFTTIANCKFIGNGSGGVFCSGGGGAIHCAGSGELIACEFIGNSSYGSGGAIRYWPASESDILILSECLFVDNWATESNTDTRGGAIAAGYEFNLTNLDLVIWNCTFSGNGVEHPDCGSGLAIIGNADVWIENTVIAFGEGGGAICCLEGASPPEITCSNIYGNAGGDWEGWIAPMSGVDGNFSEDPLFCDIPSGYFWLEDCSPCLPGNHPAGYECGVIGALRSGCACGTPTQPTTWGAIKSIYR